MFETAELGRKVDKAEFDALAPDLRIEMVEIQQRLRHARFPVIVVFAGVHGAGKSESMNLLNEWMDPRWIVTRAYGEPSDEERERPEFWRYWRDLPHHGRLGLFLSSWYSRPVLDRVYGVEDEAAFDARLDRVLAFERALADDGAVIRKFWMHLGRDAQKARLEALAGDPLQSWRVTDLDWTHWRMYDDFVAVAERAIRRTSAAHAPWTIVEGADARYRSLAVVTGVRDAIAGGLAREEARIAGDAAAPDLPGKAAHAAVRSVRPPSQPSVLRALDMERTLSKDDYKSQLREERARLARLWRRARERGLSAILAVEGPDAGGKGGAIRRMAAALDARDYQVIPVGAPTDEERGHHYLWRFWRQLARAGRVTVFDRSWYGRVLVERVEGLAREDEWQRAYAEINDFEEQLVTHGIVLVKLWIHVTPDEQLKRFKKREKTPYKRWKLTDEDWRNREKWDAYEEAADDMVERTSTALAPWVLVEGNDKKFARVKVIRTLADRLDAALGDPTSESGSDEFGSDSGAD